MISAAESTLEHELKMRRWIQIACVQTRTIETNVTELRNFKLEYDGCQTDLSECIPIFTLENIFVQK